MFIQQKVDTVGKYCLGKVLDPEIVKRLTNLRRRLEAEEVRRIVAIHRAIRQLKNNNKETQV